MLQKQKHILLPLGLIFITLTIWIGSKWFFGDWFENPYKYPAKFASLSATILFCISMILSGRTYVVNKLFGGLDIVYKAHIMCGAGGFVLLLFHPLFLAFDKLPNVLQFIQFFGIQSFENNYDIGHSAGVITFGLLVLLLALSAWRRLPYHIWKQTHEYMWVWFVLAIGHILLVDADIATYPLLKIWMYIWLGLALWFGIYIRYFYEYFGPKYTYEIDEIEHFDSSIEVWLKPVGRAIVFNPGQYVFIHFNGTKPRGDYHPFSICSAPRADGRIKLGIKELGDYTNQIHKLSVGAMATIFGAYGRVYESITTHEKDIILVGGGIGITPFMSIWEAATTNAIQPKKYTNLSLVYAVNNAKDATFDNDFRATLPANATGELVTQNNLTYNLYDTSKKGYLSAQYLLTIHPSLLSSMVYLCGPKPMTSSLINQLTQMGVKKSQIVVEEFEMRLPISRWFKG
jgi:predicted ferric reductase